MNYYITINHTPIPVTETVFKAWCQGERKERYCRERDAAHGVLSYDALDTPDFNGCELFPDLHSPSVEDMVEKHLALAKLRLAVASLAQEEKRLLLRLYVYQQSLRTIAAEDKLAVSTVQYRHQKLLRKLREIMEKTA